MLGATGAVPWESSAVQVRAIALRARRGSSAAQMAPRRTNIAAAQACALPGDLVPRPGRARNFSVSCAGPASMLKRARVDACRAHRDSLPQCCQNQVLLRTRGGLLHVIPVLRAPMKRGRPRSGASRRPPLLRPQWHRLRERPRRHAHQRRVPHVCHRMHRHQHPRRTLRPRLALEPRQARHRHLRNVLHGVLHGRRRRSRRRNQRRSRHRDRCRRQSRHPSRHPSRHQN